MEPHADRPKVLGRSRGRKPDPRTSEILSHAGIQAKFGVVTGRPESSRSAETASQYGITRLKKRRPIRS